jgi:hypothetical protein
MEQINDTWQVMVNGQVYETDLNGLVQWYMEGCFQPDDKVKKGNRNWIEAWKVPQLQRIFNSAPGFPAAVSGQQQTVTTVNHNQQPDYGTQAQVYQQQPQQVQSQPLYPQSSYSIDSNNVNQNVYGITTHATVYDNQHQNSQQQFYENQYQTEQNWQAPPSPAYVAENCVYHPQTPAKYMCRSCSAFLCNDCPKKMGMNVFICPNCGAMCDLYEQLKKKREIAFRKNQGFGLEDLGQALAYPFKFPASLIGGAFLYAIFQFGGIIGFLLAKMLLFGCIVVIIRQVAWGRMDKNFISEIGENGILDDLIKPGFLGFGVTLVSWGPMIIGAIIAIYMMLSAASMMMQQQALPENQPRMNFELQAMPNVRNAERPFRNDSIQSKKEFEKHPVFEDEENPMNSKKSGGTIENNYLSAFLTASIPLVLLIVIGALWGIFYYPMALTIAGYTQDFLATINPLVGIDTMKRMGGTYFKAFGMYVAIWIISIALSIIVYIVTMPFNSPFGNIPKNLLDGGITFYTSMVIACLLGLALFKCSDKLGIETD